MEELNVIINSKNLNNNSEAVVNLQTDFVIASNEEAHINMTSFSTIKSFYSVQTGLNDKFIVTFKVAGVVTEIHPRLLSQGNYDVNTLIDEIDNLLNGALFDISYDTKLNKFLFKNLFNPNIEVWFTCENCGDLIGFENGKEILITEEGIYSDKFVNLSGFSSMLLSISGDIDVTNTWSNLENSDFVNQKIIGIIPIGDIPPMDMITYRDDNQIFRSKISNKKISSFTIKITNENGDEFQDLDNWIMVLKISKAPSYEQDTKMSLYLHNIEFYMMSLYSYLSVPSRINMDDVTDDILQKKYIV